MKNTRTAQVRQKTMKVFISLYDRRETAMLSTKSDKHKKILWKLLGFAIPLMRLSTTRMFPKDSLDRVRWSQRYKAIGT